MPLPHHWKQYSQSIDNRCQDLIDYRIWDGMTLDRYRLWKKNFQTDEEKFLAACMLDCLMYRSANQINAMLEDNMVKNIGNIFRLCPPPINANTNFPDSLKDRSIDPKIRIVVTVKSSDGPTKGAYAVGRAVKQNFQLKEKYVIEPDKINSAYNDEGVRTFIFVDDISGTGRTFLSVYNECVKEQLNNSYVVFAPLTIHDEAIKNIKRSCNDVKICYAERLDSSHSFFSFMEEKNLKSDVLRIYSNLLREKLPSVSNTYKRGFGKLELLYLFSNSCPNNSLPVLYHNLDGWDPLFARS